MSPSDLTLIVDTMSFCNVHVAERLLSLHRAQPAPLAPPAPAHAHDPLCSPTLWAQVLVSGSTGSYLQGSCQWSRQRARESKATLSNHPSPTPTFQQVSWTLLADGRGRRRRRDTRR